MANELYFVLQDAKGDTSRITIPMGGTVADIITQAPAIGALIQAFTDGGLVAAGVNVELDLGGFAGWGPVATLASDVQEKAEFVIRTVNGYLKRINIPTVEEDIFLPNSPLVDLTDPAIAAFVTFLEDGLDTPEVYPVDSRGEDLTFLETARENWGKRRR